MIELTAGTMDGKLMATRMGELERRRAGIGPRPTCCDVDVGAAAVIEGDAPILE
jgi:hypothetical protein